MARSRLTPEEEEIRKQMEGDNRERRTRAKEARHEGKAAGGTGATLGASKQRTDAKEGMSHQEKIDLIREGKHNVISENTPKARPSSRDPETDDRERSPR